MFQWEQSVCHGDGAAAVTPGGGGPVGGAGLRRERDSRSQRGRSRREALLGQRRRRGTGLEAGGSGGGGGGLRGPRGLQGRWRVAGATRSGGARARSRDRRGSSVSALGPREGLRRLRGCPAWVCGRGRRLVSVPPGPPQAGQRPGPSAGCVVSPRRELEPREDRRWACRPAVGPGHRPPCPRPSGLAGAAGERNLGPEPHKAGVAFTACLCCQLPTATAVKAASPRQPGARHIPLYGLEQYPGPTGSDWALPQACPPTIWPGG